MARCVCEAARQLYMALRVCRVWQSRGWPYAGHAFMLLTLTVFPSCVLLPFCCLTGRSPLNPVRRVRHSHQALIVGGLRSRSTESSG
eukprot:46422-Eustigmatos_ZCMA.PRE.1